MTITTWITIDCNLKQTACRTCDHNEFNWLFCNSWKYTDWTWSLEPFDPESIMTNHESWRQSVILKRLVLDVERGDEINLVPRTLSDHDNHELWRQSVILKHLVLDVERGDEINLVPRTLESVGVKGIFENILSGQTKRTVNSKLNQTSSIMFDHAFYKLVIGFCDYVTAMKQNPEIFIPMFGNRELCFQHLNTIEDQFHVRISNFYMNYYMKKYFEYFNLCHPTDNMWVESCVSKQ